MLKISLFKVGLVAMLFFVLASNVLNYVSIATSLWIQDRFSMLWQSCYANSGRARCFGDIPAALIATGTALNCLSFVLIIVAQLALILPKFRDSFALYFVIGSLATTLLSLVFNSTGWYFVFVPAFQNVINSIDNQGATALLKYGWSFWLMTPTFGCSVIAAIIGSAILGCTCVTNEVEKVRKDSQRGNAYIRTGVENPNFSGTNMYFSNDPNDPQVLRL